MRLLVRLAAVRRLSMVLVLIRERRNRFVMVAVNLLQVNKLKEVIEEVDNEAFILITDAQEVIGKGFTTPCRTDADRKSRQRM